MRISLELELKPMQVPDFIQVSIGDGSPAQVDVADLNEEDLISVADAWFHDFYANVNARRAAKQLPPVREPNSGAQE
jgi:hypothetical protein